MAKDRRAAKRVRQARVRYRIGQIRGDRLRLSIFRSVKHIYAQIIDDTHGKTLVAASTLEEELRGQSKDNGKKGSAAAVGKAIAEKAMKADIRQVVFDRGGCLYHGRVKELAESARAAGLEF